MPKGYTLIQIILHWVVFLLVALQFVLHDSISAAFRSLMREGTFEPNGLVLQHIVGGVLILALVAWRLVLRLKRGAPLPPENEPAPLKTLSHVAHWAFYALLTAMSVTGLVAWFGDATAAAQAHNVLKVALLAFIALHVLAVPFHRLVLKNNVMQRMIRPA